MRRPGPYRTRHRPQHVHSGARRSLADHPHGPRTTFNDFEAAQPGERVDYVLAGAAVGVDRFGVLADLDDRGRYPSDHFPVRADLTLGE
ncbi:hypothetical protein BRC75_09800 [Halobacteriales archaeon QH_7_69_31]|nr:MAG: hypothetical protein BRC75_09800 [Halobacteriales archaeon QH_7_69_31]